MSDRELPHARRSFDRLITRAGSSDVTLAEAELLAESHWRQGQDARLREDARFRPTPWGRWMRAEDVLANDFVHRSLVASGRDRMALAEALAAASSWFGRRAVLCEGDPRLVCRDAMVRLAASELSDEPWVEAEVGGLEKFSTHLPLHTLAAAAASEPAGDWGPSAHEARIETLGWVRVDHCRESLTDRMFIARVVGHSMDNGRSGLSDGAYVIFELWPTGSQQARPVLVRGAFADPETGAFAVKKYVAQTPGDGPARVALVSLNPDKARFPDIVVEPETADGLTVVARVVEPLAKARFARRPRPARRVGRRDLESASGQARVFAGLAEHAARFFEDEAADGSSEAGPEAAEATAAQRARWQSRLVCLDAEAGGLHVEVGPLPGLWRFVRVLVGRTPDGAPTRLLAANARARPARVAVPPGQGPWVWVAEGFEDDEDVDLSPLDLPGLPHDRVSVFRVGADGAGRRLEGTALSPGQRYRLLVPPAAWTSEGAPLPVARLADDWRLIELALAVVVDGPVEAAVEALGLSVGAPMPGLAFGAARWPDAWRAGAGGAPFAVFDAEGPAGTTRVIVEVRACDVEVEGEARLFVLGPAGQATLPLPAGDGATVELADLGVGRYVCAVVHRRTRVAPARLAFAVEPPAARIPPARWGLAGPGWTLDAQPGAIRRHRAGDLATLEGRTLSGHGPPGWPVRVSWHALAPEAPETHAFDAAGALAGEAVLDALGERLRRAGIGDVVLDAGELGALCLAHDRRLTPAAIETAVRALVAERAAMVERDRGVYVRLRPRWFEPMGRWLGYEVGPLWDADGIAGDGSDGFHPGSPPAHVAVAPLWVFERRRDHIERRCARLLVMLETLDPAPDDALLDWVDEVCLTHGVDDVVLSTGLAWAAHRRRRRLSPRVWHLPDVLDAPAAWLDFLREMAEGV